MSLSLVLRMQPLAGGRGTHSRIFVGLTVFHGPLVQTNWEL